MRILPSLTKDEQLNLIDPLLDILSRMTVHINYHRKNSGIGRTQVFGLTDRRSLGYGPVVNNKKYPELYKALKTLGNSIVPFDFDCIVLNHNYITKPHRDKNNKGESLIISFGNYQGGELVINGEVVDTKLTPVIFDGSLLEHYNFPLITGNKYSVVFFSNKLKDKSFYH
jgi:hypothetical protein